MSRVAIVIVAALAVSMSAAARAEAPSQCGAPQAATTAAVERGRLSAGLAPTDDPVAACMHAYGLPAPEELKRRAEALAEELKEQALFLRSRILELLADTLRDLPVPPSRLPPTSPLRIVRQ